MTFSTQSNAIQKLLDLSVVSIIGVSILMSQANPIVVKAMVESTPEAFISLPDEEVDAVEAPAPRPAKRTLKVVATAYSSEAAQTDSTPCIPAMWKFNLCKYFKETGIEDTIAANFLPLGAEVRFPEIYGDKIFVVRDRMNSKYNGKSRIDFWKKDRGSAVKFGVARIKMEVL